MSADDLAALLRAAHDDPERLGDFLGALAETLVYLPVESGGGDARVPLRMRHEDREVVAVFVDEQDLTHSLADGQPYIGVRAGALGASWDDATCVALHVGPVGAWLTPDQVRSLAAVPPPSDQG